MNHRVLPKLTLTAGLRYNHVIIDSKFDTAFIPFLLQKVKLVKGIYGSLGLAY
ncbi:MAG: hypothetical protein R2777_04955 [Chitinophagales bacterium]